MFRTKIEEMRNRAAVAEKLQERSYFRTEIFRSARLISVETGMAKASARFPRVLNVGLFVPCSNSQRIVRRIRGSQRILPVTSLSQGATALSPRRETRPSCRWSSLCPLLCALPLMHVSPLTSNRIRKFPSAHLAVWTCRRSVTAFRFWHAQ